MFIYGTVEEDYDEDGENGKRSNEERRVMNCGNAYGTSNNCRSLLSLPSLPIEPSGTTWTTAEKRWPNATAKATEAARTLRPLVAHSQSVSQRVCEWASQSVSNWIVTCSQRREMEMEMVQGHDLTERRLNAGTVRRIDVFLQLVFLSLVRPVAITFCGHGCKLFGPSGSSIVGGTEVATTTEWRCQWMCFSLSPLLLTNEQMPCTAWACVCVMCAHTSLAHLGDRSSTVEHGRNQCVTMHTGTLISSSVHMASWCSTSNSSSAPLKCHLCNSAFSLTPYVQYCCLVVAVVVVVVVVLVDVAVYMPEQSIKLQCKSKSKINLIKWD